MNIIDNAGEEVCLRFAMETILLPQVLLRFFFFGLCIIFTTSSCLAVHDDGIPSMNLKPDV